MTAPAQLIIRPREPLYDVEYGGQVIVRNARDPEHAAARVLLSMGVTGPAETLTERSPGVCFTRLSFDIESFAGSFVEETSRGGLKVKSWRGEAAERLPTGGSDT